MLVGARRNYQYFWQSNWFLKNNGALSNSFCEIYLISIIKLWKNQSLKPKVTLITQASHLNEAKFQEILFQSEGYFARWMEKYPSLFTLMNTDRQARIFLCRKEKEIFWKSFWDNFRLLIVLEFKLTFARMSFALHSHSCIPLYLNKKFQLCKRFE